MSKMNLRLLAVRQICGLTQGEFGKRIGISGSQVNMLEKGTRKITDRVITSICFQFGIDSEWLRTGEGDMLSENTKLYNLLDEYNLDALDRSIVESYINLPESQRKSIKDFILSIVASNALSKDEKKVSRIEEANEARTATTSEYLSMLSKEEFIEISIKTWEAMQKANAKTTI